MNQSDTYDLSCRGHFTLKIFLEIPGWRLSKLVAGIFLKIYTCFQTNKQLILEKKYNSLTNYKLHLLLI